MSDRDSEIEANFWRGQFKRIALVVLALTASSTSARGLKLSIDDCGPLARDELGVVFTARLHGTTKTYFAKGVASEVCPKLDKANYVIGVEEPYCKNFKPLSPKECGTLKVFVIHEFVYD